MLPEEPLRWQRLAGALVAILGVALICARLLSFNGWFAFLGGVGYHDRCGECRVFQRAAESSKDAARTVDAGRVADDFRNSAAPPGRIRWSMEIRCASIGPASAILCLLYLAVIGSSFTFLLLYWLMPRMSVTNLQTISLITPPGAIVLGWACGGERLSAWSLLGAGLVLLGVWMIFRRIDAPTVLERG